jgi:hypothetical protein
LQEPFLPFEAAAVADERPVRADDAMAGEDDRDRVPVHERPYRARRAGVPRFRRKRAVRRDLSVRHSPELVHHAEAERRGEADVDRELERSAPSVEVLVELALRLVERLRDAEEPGAEVARERLEVALGLGVELDAAEAAIRRRDEQCADRRVDEVVRDVEQMLACSGVAKTEIEFGRNGSQWASFRRNLRMPADAAWRAAVAFEPSAAPISA